MRQTVLYMKHVRMCQTQRWNRILKSISIGSELFHELIESNSYYVDKSMFLKTVFAENTSKVMLITGPGLFGKTLTMSTFYDFLGLDPENPGDISGQEKWFKDTKIFEDKEFCREYTGKALFFNALNRFLDKKTPVSPFSKPEKIRHLCLSVFP